MQLTKKNIKVCWFIFRVIRLYFESQENTCSHTSVSTYNMLETTIARAVNVNMHQQLEIVGWKILYLLKLWKLDNVWITVLLAPAVCICPFMCILSTANFSDASCLVCSVSSALFLFLANFVRWQASSQQINSNSCCYHYITKRIIVFPYLLLLPMHLATSGCMAKKLCRYPKVQ